MEAQLFLSDTLALNFNNLCSALAGAAVTTLALSLTFTASGAAVGFWYFFPAEKGLGLRGYERVKYLGGWWVTPTTGKFDFLPLAMRY